jgi:hypothetical protein
MNKLVNKKTKYIWILAIVLPLVIGLFNPDNFDKVMFLIPFSLIYFFIFYVIEKYFSFVDLKDDEIIKKYLFFSKSIKYREVYSFQRIRTYLADFIGIVDVNGRPFIKNMEPYFANDNEIKDFYDFLKSKNSNIKTNINFTKPINIPWPPKEYFSDPK